MENNYKIITGLKNIDNNKIKEMLNEYSQLDSVATCGEKFCENLDDLASSYGDDVGNFYVIKNKDTDEYIGCVGYTITRPNQIKIKRLYIREQYRGNGYARLLINKLLNEAKEKQFENIFLITNHKMEPAINLYKTLDFEVVLDNCVVRMELNI
ncbi:ribosomal protein S18 acetylase RimI-like enzyme [Bacilli bacterium PM5-3]|nr:ribosomal protein S18 acetylase RimI-like enzyme [Bacilli bacterium PM5-3]MDH6603841.1 ribosomal protein S18 acetylase RimI-like enzyme [Bacilli bacterium PM5-9]